jgi:glucan phosphoethanolaminetransferase (alkaline phosphatase superfamily)
MVEYAKLREMAAPAEKKGESETRHAILFDLYIKAHSYAILNKVLFWLSLFSGVLILLWPSLTIVFKKRLETQEWARSPVLLTSLSAMAAVMFSFYSQYKDKQTSTESLMRYALFSKEEITVVSTKVAEEMSKIDKGFTYSTAIGNEKAVPKEK